MDSYRRKDDDRGREHRLVSTPPSLRTGRADLPHPALQSVVLPARGLTVQRMGVSCKLRGSRLASSVSIRVVRSGGSPCSHQRQGPLRRFQPIRQYRRFFPHGPNFTSPPSCTPSLPRHYPASSLLWVLTPARRRDPVARSAPRGGRYLRILSPLAPRRSPR